MREESKFFPAVRRVKVEESEILKMSIADVLRELVAGLTSTATNWLSVCELLANVLILRPEYRNQIVEKFAAYPNGYLTRMEKIGCGLAYVELLNAWENWAKMLSRCPLSEQTYYFHNPIEVLLPSGDIQLVMASIMDKKMLDQVFAYDHVRDLKEQAVLLRKVKEEIAHAIASPKKILPATTTIENYEISKNGLSMVVTEPTKFTRKELLSVLRKMEEIASKNK